MSDNPYASPLSTPNDDKGFKHWPVTITGLLTLASGLIFLFMHLMDALSLHLVGDSAALLVCLATRRKLAASGAFLACGMMAATALNTNWGFSSPQPSFITVAWKSLIAALAAQLALYSLPLLPADLAESFGIG